MSAASTLHPSDPYHTISIDPDGACSYLLAVACALHALKHEGATPGMRSLLARIRDYYEIEGELTYEAFRSFLKKLTTRYDVQQFLVPVIFQWQHELASGQKTEPSQISSVTTKETWSHLDMIQRLGQTLGFRMDATGCVDGPGSMKTDIQPGSSFVIHCVPGHFDLGVHPTYLETTQAQRFADNSSRYSLGYTTPSRLSEGYFSSQGLITYGVEDANHSRLLIGNELRKHLTLAPVVVPAKPVTPPVKSKSRFATLLSPRNSLGVLEEFHRHHDVQTLNARVNALLDRMGGSLGITDAVARGVLAAPEAEGATLIHEKLTEIVEAKTHQARFASLEEFEKVLAPLESRKKPPAGSVATPFRTCGFEAAGQNTSSAMPGGLPAITA